MTNELPQTGIASSTGPEQAALSELLLALADDEFIFGFANSEWTGIAPVLEEDIAFSSLAQDELGHARALYELAATLGGTSADALAYGRAPASFRCAQLVERPRGDWAYSVMRQFLYDTADYVRLHSLRASSYTPLAQTVAGIIREEKYHLLHGQTWLARLAEGGTEARARQAAALDALWADALALFEPTEGEELLLAAGVLAEPSSALAQRWVGQLEEPLRRYGLSFPFEEQGALWRPLVAPAYGGRRGLRSPSFQPLYDTITSVYRIDPEAQW
ncbi:MAG TPA: 1,2-phenylacetyl-CoA epoxidase subunit PaaC [Roseiflexaceae bacterium]|nr:1,2-phenylacetyl-CoA epoxidase subunit PaaC [Roseiflexaceae bacterium]